MAEPVEVSLSVAPVSEELNAALTGEAQKAAAQIGGGGAGIGGLAGESNAGGEDSAAAIEGFQAQADSLLAIQQTTIEQMVANQQAGTEVLSGIESERAATSMAGVEAEGAAKKQMSDEELAREKAKNASLKAQRVQAANDALSNLEVLAQGNKEFGALFKAGAVAKTIIDTYSGAQAAFTSLAGIPVVGYGLGAAAAAAIAAGFVRVNQIRSQQFQEGGFPQGRNALIRVNESGQEAVLNAQAVSRLGREQIEQFNRGGDTMTRSANLTYAPNMVVNVNGGNPQDVIAVLEQQRELFARFMRDMKEKGYT